MDLQVGHTIDRYTVEELVGKGGMAAVFRVRHNTLGSIHAMKVLDLPTRSMCQRLIQEGRLQSSLRHPNLVAVTDVVVVGDYPALIMEFVEGCTLLEFIDQSLSLEQIDGLARGVLRGVVAAHRHGLIHRDLKPSNVLVCIRDDLLVPKVSDFGLAKVMNRGLSPGSTGTNTMMGTPGYMAPEQMLDARNVDQRADVFSLGVVLYELVTGRTAFKGEDMIDVLSAARDGRVIAPSELVDELPERMERAILTALIPDSERRVQDCRTLLDLWCAETEDPPRGIWTGQILDRVRELGRRTGGQSMSETQSFVASSELDGRGSADWNSAWTPLPGHPSNDSLADPMAPTRAERSGAAWSRVHPGSHDDQRNAATVQESLEPEERAFTSRYLQMFILGFAVEVPFVLGLIAAMYGDLAEPMTRGGLFMWLVLPIGIAASAFPWMLAGMERGGWRLFGAWWVLPAAVVMVGTVGTGVGMSIVIDVLPSFALDDRPAAAAMGTSVALITDLGGLTLGALGLMSGAIGLAWAWRRRVQRPAVRTGPFNISLSGVASLVLASCGGTALWLLHPLLSGSGNIGGKEVFLALFVLLWCAGAHAWLAPHGPETEPHMNRPRFILAVSSVGAVALASFAADVAGLVKINQSFFEHQELVSRLEAAEAFEHALVQSVPFGVFGWANLAWVGLAVLVVSTPSMLRVWRPTVSLRYLFGPLVMLGVVIALRVWSNDLTLTVVRGVAPDNLAIESAWYLGFPLYTVANTDEAWAWAPIGMRATMVPEGMEVASGDVVIAINDQPTHDVRTMLHLFRDCRCDQDVSACGLVEGCLSAGHPIRLTVTRGPGASSGRATNHSVTVPMHMASFDWSEAGPDFDARARADRWVDIVDKSESWGRDAVGPDQVQGASVRLREVLEAREMPLLVGLASVSVIGDVSVSPAMFTGWLQDTLEALPATRVIRVPDVPPDANTVAWAEEQARELGVAYIVLPTLGTLGDQLILNMERVSVHTVEGVDARSFHSAGTVALLLERIDEAWADLFVDGGMGWSKEWIEDEMVSRVAVFGDCYAEWGEGRSGTMKLQWVIKTSGVVGDAEIIEDGIGSPQLSECVLDTLKASLFPPLNSGAITIAYPIVFSSNAPQ